MLATDALMAGLGKVAIVGVGGCAGVGAGGGYKT